MKKTTILRVIALLAALLMLCACQKAVPAGGEAENTSESTTADTREPVSVNILAVGDNLIHGVIYNQAHARSTTGGYDFTYAYKNIASTVASADISIINQETIIDPEKAPSTYPCFNSPTELGDEMVKIGFDVFNIANNHSLDKGESGLRNAIKFWKSKNVVFCGAYLDEEDYKTIPTNTVKGIKFAYVGLTEPTNGLSLPEGSKTILMLGADEDRIEKRVKAASEISDMTIVNVHWGEEYTHTPTERQHELAQKLADWGADIIIGTHPHVIQPVEYITVTKNYQKNTTEVTKAKFTGTVTHYDSGFSNVRVYNLADYTDALASRHGVRSTTPSFSLNYLNSLLHDVVSDEFLEG